ncbi:hypothetical protein K0M31_012518, partial [Melipona bicolor]
RENGNVNGDDCPTARPSLSRERERERESVPGHGAASGFSTSQPLGDLASQGATNPGSIQASLFVELFHACGPGGPLTSSLRKSPGEFREPATETR